MQQELLEISRIRDTDKLQTSLFSFIEKYEINIEIYSEYSYWWKDKHPVLYAPCVLNFYKTNAKPDSTIAWFINKKWYKNELNESRK